MAKLDIDITDKKTRDIIEILELYPYGHLEIKFERVFWVSDYSEADFPRGSPEYSPGRRGGSDPRREPNLGERFHKMADVLGSMVGPPPAPRSRERR